MSLPLPKPVRPHAGDLQPNPFPRMSVTADATLVARTRRVVHERARQVRLTRSLARSLFLPVCLCAVLVLILCSASWSLLDQYEPTPTGIPDASSQLLVMVCWFLPVSAAIVAVALRRKGRQSEKERTR